MQLDLFEDNRPGILLNCAHDHILSRDFHRAVSVYEQLLTDYPGDRHASAMLKLVSELIELLPAPDASISPEQLHKLWLRLGSLHHSALRSTLLDILYDAMCALPHAEQMYRAPNFHLGQILMECGRYDRAADCFQKALAAGNVPRGRFMAWRGDALTLAGNEVEAIESYLKAFLHDPNSVDIQSIKNRTISDLYTSLSSETTDETEEQETPAWLPVWGWLQGVFSLPLQPSPVQVPDVSSFEIRFTDNSVSRGRLWFDMLTHAERLRTTRRDDPDLLPMRRLLKKTNGFMFKWYLEKIS
ncbi:MAG: tetratricopeptide repeat protein [Desulfuromonadales bacterium]|nr:tetratricopeptide repeat protein [Desulfuromonadales bacterium]